LKLSIAFAALKTLILTLRMFIVLFMPRLTISILFQFSYHVERWG
jgi:hypothetical protein